MVETVGWRGEDGLEAVEAGLVVDLEDLVRGLQDEDVEPHAEVRGDHVHEAEPREKLVLVDVHL